MKDRLGIQLNIGDEVAHSKKGDTRLHFATIEELTSEGEVLAKIRRISTGRLLVNLKSCMELMSVEVLKKSVELFKSGLLTRNEKGVTLCSTHMKCSGCLFNTGRIGCYCELSNTMEILKPELKHIIPEQFV